MTQNFPKKKQAELKTYLGGWLNLVSVRNLTQNGKMIPQLLTI